MTHFILSPRRILGGSIPAGVLHLALLLFATWQVSAAVPFPFYEPFPLNYTNGGSVIQVPQGGSDYPAQSLAGANTPSLTVWTIGGSPGGGASQIVGGPAALTYGILATNPFPSAGLYIRTNQTTANRSRGVLLPTVSSGSVYLSFLMNLEQAPMGFGLYSNKVFALLSTLTSGTPNAGSTAIGIGVDTESRLTLTKRSIQLPSATNDAPLSAGTHLVVARYTFNPDFDDDEVAVWLDPDPSQFGVSEENVPPPTLSTTAGQDQASISSFYILHPQSGGVRGSLFVDEIRVSTSWADVTPTGTVCLPATIGSHPVNQMVSEGLSATFAVGAGGTSPLFQWQRSTDNGGTWDNIAGATNAAFLTPVLSTADNGTQFRVQVTAACNSTVATSDPAVVTVNPATPTARGVVVHDEFSDGSRLDLPYSPQNSIWLATAGLEAGFNDDLVGTPQTGSAVWLGFFTDDQTAPPGEPVHLAVGDQIQVTLPFSAMNIVESGGNSIRVGLFDYADGGTRPIQDGSGVANSGANVRGYMLVMNFGRTFDDNTPLEIYARNNLSAADLMGTTGNYLSLGSGPEDGEFSGSPAFENDTVYTLRLTVARSAFDTVRVTANISGNGSNWTYSVTDSTYALPRFDAFAIRVNSLQTTADQFSLRSFRVEVQEGVIPVLPFEITEAQQLNPTAFKLSWDSVAGKTYQVQSTTSLSSGNWSTNATLVAEGAATSFTNSTATAGQEFYRVVALP